jgi:hypothetical protein
VSKDWVAIADETAQEHVPEPVVAAGILQPAGTWGAQNFPVRPKR